MLKKKVSVRLQDYNFCGHVKQKKICVNLPKEYAEGGTPIKIIVTGKTSNNSEYLDFEFYD